MSHSNVNCQLFNLFSFSHFSSENVKCFAGSSFLNVHIFFFSLSCMIANGQSLGVGLLDWALGNCGEHFAHFLDNL